MILYDLRLPLTSNNWLRKKKTVSTQKYISLVSKLLKHYNIHENLIFLCLDKLLVSMWYFKITEK